LKAPVFVSIEEQDQILGRLTRERRESVKHLAALSAKLEQAGAELQRVGAEFKGFLLPEAERAISKARQAIPHIPNSEALLATLQELEAERKRLNDIETSLRAFDS